MFDSETILEFADELGRTRARALRGAATLLERTASGVDWARVVWNTLWLEGPLVPYTLRPVGRAAWVVTPLGAALISPMAWASRARQKLRRRAAELRRAASAKS